MRITLNIEDELLAKAQRVSGVKERTALVREGLKALIERESARRLAKLGDSEPRLQPVPGRRSTPTGERRKASQMLRGTVVLRDDLITPPGHE